MNTTSVTADLPTAAKIQPMSAGMNAVRDQIESDNTPAGMPTVFGVSVMREGGMSWAECGRALGVTKSLVYRFAKKHSLLEIKPLEDLEADRLARAPQVDVVSDDFADFIAAAVDAGIVTSGAGGLTDAELPFKNETFPTPTYAEAISVGVVVYPETEKKMVRFGYMSEGYRTVLESRRAALMGFDEHSEADAVREAADRQAAGLVRSDAVSAPKTWGTVIREREADAAAAKPAFENWRGDAVEAAADARIERIGRFAVHASVDRAIGVACVVVALAAAVVLMLAVEGGGRQEFQNKIGAIQGKRLNRTVELGVIVFHPEHMLVDERKYFGGAA